MLPVQARGITMKSSSICLLHVPGAAALPGGANACPDADKLAKGSAHDSREAMQEYSPAICGNGRI